MGKFKTVTIYFRKEKTPIPGEVAILPICLFCYCCVVCRWPSRVVSLVARSLVVRYESKRLASGPSAGAAAAAAKSQVDDCFQG